MTKLLDQTQRDYIKGEDDGSGLDKTLFVVAGAGAGKTDSIKFRLKSLFLKRDLDPEKLVVITYTKKAASELQERIRSVVEEMASSEDIKIKERALYVLNNLNKAIITTVHAFCSHLLRQYPVEFMVDPLCEVADDRTSKSMSEKVFKTFKNKIELEEDALKGFVEDERYDDVIKLLGHKKLFEIFKVFYSNRDMTPKKIKGGFNSPYTGDYSKTREEILEGIRTEVISLARNAYDVYDSVKPGKEDDAFMIAFPDISKGLERYGFEDGELKDKLAFENYLEDATSFFLEKCNKGNMKGFTNEDALRAYKASYKLIDKLFLIKKTRDSIDKYNLMVDIYPIFSSCYHEFKLKNALIDFSDCLLKIRDGLKENSDLKKLLIDRFDCLIIDEFQDSDPIQSEIIFHLASLDTKNSNWKEQKVRPGKLFFVGDPKQSIYGFARAEIEIYMEVLDLVHNSSGGENVGLSTNFRSSKNVLDFVNEHFPNIIKEIDDPPGISPKYDSMDLSPKNKDFKGEAKILELSIDTDPKADIEINQKGKLNAYGLLNRESFLMAHHISEKIKSGNYKAGDFLLLFRTGKGMEEYEKWLSHFNVPVINTKSKDFLKQEDVMGLVSLLGFLHNPNEFSYLYGLLKSSFLALKDSECILPLRKVLDQIYKEKKEARSEGKFYQLTGIREIELEKATVGSKTLSDLYEIARSNFSLVKKFKVATEVIALYSNSKAMENDRHLVYFERVKALLRSELKLNHFNEALTVENIVNSASEDSKAHKQKDSDDVADEGLVLDSDKPHHVRLMTIHASKGLESKVVILCNSKGHMPDFSKHLIDRRDDSIFRIPDGIDKKFDFLSIGEKEIVESKNLKELKRKEEEKRVLYVGATRAEEELYLTKFVDEKCSNFFAPLYDLLDGCEKETIELSAINDLYQNRFHVSSKESGFSKADLTFSEHYNEVQKHFDEIRGFDGVSRAVTTILREKGSDLFKTPHGGRKQGMAFGNLVHEAMEVVCYWLIEGVSTSEESIIKLVKKINLENDQLSDDYQREVVGAINLFLESELAKRIKKSTQIFPEVPFHIKGEVHGIIDLVIEEEDGNILVIDWKSDLKPSSEVKALYKEQVAMYVKALEEDLGIEGVTGECVFLF